MIADSIPRVARDEERSFFFVEFQDGSQRDWTDTEWRSFANLITAQYCQKTKDCYATRLPVRRVCIGCRGLEDELFIQEGEQAYQETRAVTFFMNGCQRTIIRGQAVGKIKDGKVIEEHFIDLQKKQIIRTV